MGHYGYDSSMYNDGYRQPIKRYDEDGNTNIMYNGDRLKINSNIGSGSLLLGLAAVAVGAYVGIKMYQKYSGK